MISKNITNAGIVILVPYLPRLFSMLSLTDKNDFKDNDARVKAVLLLHYIVWDTEEFSDSDMLLINKLLIGMEINDPISLKIELNNEEKEAVASMLNAVLQNWKKLKNTPIARLRETFLQREGKIEFSEDGAQITVEEKAFDNLIDDIPWNFKMTKLPWMNKSIMVRWR